MATDIYRPSVKHIACGVLDIADVNAVGAIVIPNEKARRIFITDAWVRPAGSPGAGTAVVLIREYVPNIACASVQVNDYVTINGITFTAKSATAIPSRQFINTANNDAATGLAACINDPTWGVRGVTATRSSATLTLISDTTLKIATSSASTLATDSGGNAFVTIAKAGLTDTVIKRAGGANATTCTYLSTPGTTRYPVEIRCTTGDVTTTTALEYVIKYTVL
jgi:hypothetical protein